MLRSLLLSADADVLETIERHCQSRGHESRSFSTAQQAELAIASGAFDLLILDLTLVGNIGVEQCRPLRAEGLSRSAYVLAIASLGVDEDSTRLIAAGANDYLVKPFRPGQLSLRLEIAERHLRDRAERRQVEASLRETVDLLALAASGTNDGFWHCVTAPGADYFRPRQPVWYSTQMKALLGLAEHEMEHVLESWAGRIHPDDKERVFQALADHLERRRPFDIDYRLRLKSGEFRWFNARGQACWDAAGRPLRMAGSIRDITERRAAEDALRESEARHRLIADTVNDILWMVQIPEDLRKGASALQIADGVARVKIGYISPAVERVLGYSPAEARALTLGQLLAPSAYATVLAAFAEEFAAAADPQPPEQRTLELDHVSKSSEIRCCEVTSVIRRDVEGRPASVLGVSRDITERRRSEQALRQERAFLRQLVDVHESERRVFAYEIHDGIMPRLTASIMHLGASQAARTLAADALVEFELGLSLLEMAVCEGRRLIGGLRPPILDEAGIVVAIEYLAHEYRPEHFAVTFHHETQFDRLAPPLENAMFRVAQEALSNAFRHSRGQRAHVELLQAGDLLRVTVRDWGAGFHPHQVGENHFGLQGIRERARLLGGHARVDSAPGEGTTVCVEFPLLLASGVEKDAAAG